MSGIASGIFFNTFGQGMIGGITSGMIANMLAANADFKINIETASWLGPMLGVGSMLTLPVASFLMNKIGRKITYILLNIPAVIGMVINAYAYNVTTLLFGRLLCGITTGCTAVLAPMIIGEFMSPQYRGIFLMLKTSFLNLGVLMIHFLTYYIHWRNVSFVVAAMFVISIMISFMWPESPYWLAEHKKLQRSEEVFYWLRGRNRDSTTEFDEIVKNQQNRNMKKTFLEDTREFFMKFKNKRFWKLIVIVALTTIMTECTGKHVFPTYTILIIKDMTSKSVDPFYYDMTLISISTISAFTSAYLVKVFKLRSLLFTTGFVGVTVLYLTSLSLYLASNGTLSKEYWWIHIFLLGLFIITVNLCCTQASLAIPGEIFPPQHRATGAVVLGYFLAIVLIISLKITPFLMANFKNQGTFTFFATGLLLSLFGLYVLLPETKNKTLQEIDDFFTHGDQRKRVPQNNKDDEENKNKINTG